jgi:hypothetical protein
LADEYDEATQRWIKRRVLSQTLLPEIIDPVMQ